MNAEAPRSETLQDRAGNVSNGLRVLVADDNPVDRKVLSTIVARAGYDVVIPPLQGCCGALHAHSGDLDFARGLARNNVDVLGTIPL